MEKCSNLRVLILSYCAFSFSSPLFHHSHTLSFLGLDHCKNNHTTELEKEANTSKWAFLHSLWVLDLHHTDWCEIFSEENMDCMGNIREINIEGFMCCNFTSQLEGKLPCLESLRIVKPFQQAETSTEIIDNSFTGKTKLQVLDLSGNDDMKNIPTSLSKVTDLQMLALDGCNGLENVLLSNSSLRSLSFDGYGPATNCKLIVELPIESSRQKPPSNTLDKKDVKTTLISLKGCTRLENLFLRGLPNLVELDLSGCANKILDIQSMVVDVPRLKRLFLLGCEHLCAIRWSQRAYTDEEIASGKMEQFLLNLELLCIDTRPADRVLGYTRPSIISQPNKCFRLQVHAITADARLARSLCAIIRYGGIERDDDVSFDLHIVSSNVSGMTSKPCDEKHIHVDAVATAGVYDDVFTEFGDALTPMQAFRQPPSLKLDRHIEIGEGSHNVASEVDTYFIALGLADVMYWYVQSLHVHDTSTHTAIPRQPFDCLRWCRVERCPNLDPVFPDRTYPSSDLETIWASDLLKARCIWRVYPNYEGSNFESLRHLHLRSCPDLQYALPLWSSSFRSLETLQIIHCGNLMQIFELEDEEYESSVVECPKLTTIHLHDVPVLRKICEVNILAPALETIRTKGCWGLRRLPALFGLDDGDNKRRKPVVEMEMDVWGALEWDGVDAGHDPSLYEGPLHSRYYKRRHLRGTVLR